MLDVAKINLNLFSSLGNFSQIFFFHLDIVKLEKKMQFSLLTVRISSGNEAHCDLKWALQGANEQALAWYWQLIRHKGI